MGESECSGDECDGSVLVTLCGEVCTVVSGEDESDLEYCGVTVSGVDNNAILRSAVVR